MTTTPLRTSGTMPRVLIDVFLPVSWQEWEQAPAHLKRAEEMDAPPAFKSRGSIPAGWFIRELGLSDTVIGGAAIKDDGNTFINTGTGTEDHVWQLVSLLKQQVRDRLGIQLRLRQQL